MFKSIRWRITLPFAFLSLVSLLGLGLYLANVVRASYVGALEDRLAREAQLISDALGSEMASSGKEVVLDERARHWSALADARVTIIDAEGNVIGESHEDRTQMDNHALRPEVAQALRGAERGSVTRFSHTLGQELLYTAVPIRQNGMVVGAVRLAIPLAEVAAQLAQVRRVILIATLAILLVTVGLAAFVASRTTRPVRELTRAVSRMTAGESGDSPLPAVRDEVGQLAHAFNVMSTRLQEQIKALEGEGARLSAVLQKMTDGVLIVDAEGRVQLINSAAARIFAVDEEAALSQSLIQVAKHPVPVILWQRCQDTSMGQWESFELSGRGYFLEGMAESLNPLLPGNTLLMFQDVTRQRQVEAVRRDFISNVSHELRTPLAALKALTETLQDGALNDPPAAQRFLGQMETEVDSLSLMVQELLELSRIESNRVPLNRGPARPMDLLAPAYERLALQAEMAGLELELSCPEDLPQVMADSQRLQQVVVNLLHNAIKFTPAGGKITLGAEALGSHVRFWVRDTGVGMDPRDLPRIFERFYKADRSRSGSGTGLGLAIARHMVEAHGGEIWAESEPGQGSTFYFTIPLA